MRAVGIASTLVVLAGCAASTRVFDGQNVRTVTNPGAVQVQAPAASPSEPADLTRPNPPMFKGRMPHSSPPPAQSPGTTVPPIDQQQLPPDRCTGGSVTGKRPAPECMPA
jgi:hypothetical protein